MGRLGWEMLLVQRGFFEQALYEAQCEYVLQIYEYSVCTSMYEIAYKREMGETNYAALTPITHTKPTPNRNPTINPTHQRTTPDQK